MTPTPGERIPITTTPNVSGLGGWRNIDGGHVCRGLVDGSAELTQPSGNDVVAFAALGIRNAYGLRTSAQRTAQPDRLPTGVDPTRVVQPARLAARGGPRTTMSARPLPVLGQAGGAARSFDGRVNLRRST